MNITASNNNDISQRGELARQQLISAALELFAENGVAGASTRQIALKAQQNIGSIAYYFGSKEGLYLAVAQWIADFIKTNFADIFNELEQFLASDNLYDDPEYCLEHIKRIVHLQSVLLARPETLNFSKVMFREQLAPTAAFDIIHNQALAPLHHNFTRLIAAYIGIDANSSQAILHTHAIIGEVLAFRAGRETLIQRIGWQEVNETEIAMIEDTLQQHIEILLQGLRAKNRR